MPGTDQNISFYQYLNLMKYDFCILLFVLSNLLQSTVATQLLEDKFCLNHLQLSDDFCANFTSQPDSTETIQILKAANLFKNLQFVIVNGPSFLLSIFIGYWLGNYPQYFKLMMTLPFLGGILLMSALLANTFYFEAPWQFMLLSYLPYSLCGGIFLIFSAAYTSISWGTPIHLVIIRFAGIEFLGKIGMLTSTYLSGILLDMNPWFPGQLKNYAGVFVVGLSINLFGILLALGMSPSFRFERDPKKDAKTMCQVVRDVFSLTRVKEMVEIFIKKRPNSGRLQLNLLISSVAICTALLNNEDAIAYQFAQRVYGLTESAYTTALTLVFIPPTIATSAFPPIFKSIFGFTDSTIAIIGCCSLSVFFLIRGLFLSMEGFIAGYIIGSFARGSSIAIRSLIVSTLEPQETARIFTVATALETAVGLGATFFYTCIFNVTIAEEPGAVMILVGILALYPLAVSCWIKLVQFLSERNRINTERERLINGS